MTLVCTATTAKDTLPRLQRFVARNLAGGVDHLFVFLDAAEPEAKEWLADHPHVTCVRTAKDWWHGDRPGQLNDRQRINANAAQHALAGLGWDAWLFHIDADEVVQVDRSLLAEVGEPAVRLGVLEAVAQPQWPQDPTYFKRPLADDELGLLTTLGVLDRPSNGAYFHGHTDGKSGVRVGAGRWLTLHDAVGEDGRALAAAEGAGFRVLHYESYSGEDFVRKWISLVEAGPTTKFRPGRQPTLVAVRALLDRGLPREVTERYLMRIFERTTADDLEVLRDLELLVEVDPDAPGGHTPAALDDQQRAALDTALTEVAAAPKERFKPPVNRPVDRDEPGDAESGGPGESDEPGALRGARRFRRRS